MTADISFAILEEVFRRSVDEADPSRAIERAIGASPPASGPVAVLSIGKCAVGMWHGAQRAIGSRISDALIIHPVGIVVEGLEAESVRFHAAPHPIPDSRSESAADAALDFVKRREAPESLLVLVSGGASALLERPITGVSLEEFLDVIAAYQETGPGIHDLNFVRSRLSRVKGGGLVRDCPVPVETLLVSDVADDAPGVIGSGPTIAIEEEQIPECVSNWLKAARLSPACGAALRDARSHPVRREDRYRVAAPFDSVSRCVARVCEEMDIQAEIVHPACTGSVESVCDRVVARIHKAAGDERLLIFYGESTISLPQERGVGGRAQQLALELARALAGKSVCGLVAGTDGIDGNSEAAGAFFSGETWNRVAPLGAEDSLLRRDAGTLLRRAGLCLDTGPTGVNHADLILVQSGQLRGAG